MTYYIYHKDNHLYIEIDNQIKYIQYMTLNDYNKIKHYFQFN